MKASEIVKILNRSIEEVGDYNVDFETNRHKYDARLITVSDKIVFALFDKNEIA